MRYCDNATLHFVVYIAYQSVTASRQTFTKTVKRTSAGETLDELLFEIRELKTDFNAIRGELVQVQGEIYSYVEK